LKVNKLDGSDIAASDLEYKDYDLTLSDNEINGIEKLSDTEYYLTVKNSLTADNILFDKISAKVNSIYGSKNHPMDETLSYALSDYGINILNVALYDTTHPDDSTSVKNFDGSETISNKLIKVRAVITSSIVNSASDTALLYYDVFDSLSAYAQFWRPDENLNSRQVVGRNIGGNTWEFSIPEDSSTIGKFISFVLKIKDLYSYRSVMKVAETDFNPRQISTRNVKVKEIKLQEGKVTILNNVINPNNGDVTKLTYTLDKAGPTSIVVYDLAGDVIKVLYGGFQDAGDFVVTWDGRNENNRIVARGVYFVRVRAPGIINQIRKVLVIK
ncbi:MAG: hypothetical protein KA885_06450, partial [Spirochaetes bacterium]|nr:hypothetical protein [Spirochaetota bacterium]